MKSIKEYVAQMLASAHYTANIRNVGVFQFPSEYRFQTHRHFDLEINYVMSGNCVIEMEDRYITLKQGECILIYPGIPHSFLVDVSKPCTLSQLEFNIQVPDMEASPLLLLREMHQGTQSHAKIVHCDNIPLLIQQIAELTGDMYLNESRRTMLELVLAQLCVVCSERIQESRAKEKVSQNDTFSHVVKHIQDNLTDDINLEKICRKYNISSRYIRRKFNETMGMSGNQYIALLRMSRAKQYLQDPGLSIAEAAFRAGYGNPQYFSRMFRETVGMSPSEYRKTCMESKFSWPLPLNGTEH